jgi:MFS superfamily sulfate permease-like transporter
VALAVDLVLHFRQVHLPTLLLGLTTLGIIVGLERTRLHPFSMLFVLAVAALLVPLFGLGEVSLKSASLPRKGKIAAVENLRSGLLGSWG